MVLKKRWWHLPKRAQQQQQQEIGWNELLLDLVLGDEMTYILMRVPIVSKQTQLTVGGLPGCRLETEEVLLIVRAGHGPNHHMIKGGQTFLYSASSILPPGFHQGGRYQSTYLCVPGGSHRHRALNPVHELSRSGFEEIRGVRGTVMWCWRMNSWFW